MTTTNLDLTVLRAGSQLPGAEQRARNTSTASENKIHDDTVARQYGFQGGLVPGATSYAYLASYLVRLLGPEWAAAGTASIRLVRPVYEGDLLRLGASVTAVEGDRDRGSITLDCWVDGPDGTRRAPGTAGLGWGEARAEQPRPAFATTTLAPRRPDQRGPISVATAPLDVPLPPVEFDSGSAAMTTYLDGIDNDNPLFRERSPWGGPLVHPGWYPNIANRVLSGNFLLGPWMHTHSEIRHLAPALAGGVYRAYGQLTAAYEKRGHQYATADVLITDGNNQPVARLLHTAIVVAAKVASN